MKHINLLQKYLANLNLLNVKFHNIHWNIVGKKFMEIHNFTETIYDNFFENIDEVAELLKMKENYPLSTMKEYLENTDLEEIQARDFTADEALKIIKSDFEYMKNQAIEIRNLADEENDFETVSMFEGFISEYSKNIWFLNSIMK